MGKRFLSTLCYNIYAVSFRYHHILQISSSINIKTPQDIYQIFILIDLILTELDFFYFHLTEISGNIASALNIHLKLTF